MTTPRSFSPGEWLLIARARGLVLQGQTPYAIFAGDRWLADVGAGVGDPGADAQVMTASKALYLALAALVGACKPQDQHLNGTQVYRVEDVQENGVVQQARAALAALALVERRA